MRDFFVYEGSIKSVRLVIIDCFFAVKNTRARWIPNWRNKKWFGLQPLLFWFNIGSFECFSQEKEMTLIDFVITINYDVDCI